MHQRIPSNISVDIKSIEKILKLFLELSKMFLKDVLCVDCISIPTTFSSHVSTSRIQKYLAKLDYDVAVST